MLDRGGASGGPRVSPVSQRCPVNPEGQTQLLGDTQVPPLLHPSSQKAEKRKRKAYQSPDIYNHWLINAVFMSGCVCVCVCVCGAMERLTITDITSYTQLIPERVSRGHHRPPGCQGTTGKHLIQRFNVKRH